MQTNLAEQYRNTSEGVEADRILRACVHCGFCTATCPTYQLLGDELDGPRGRIYLIKQLLEGQPVSAATQLHLDRCLSCRSCETTCPSGVEYGRLAEIGRNLVEQQVARPRPDALKRYLLRKLVPYPKRFTPLLRIGQLLRPALPGALQDAVPPRQTPGVRPNRTHTRTVLILEGCVQSATTPATNNATARILDKLGIQTIAAARAGCCGAVSLHLSAHQEGLRFVRRNIDAWWPHIEQGAEAIVVTASGCGTVVKDYGHLLRHDTAYADKARRISALARDISEVLRDEALPLEPQRAAQRRVAFHSPCTLQHGQQLKGIVEGLLERAGFILTQVPDAHLCCGSAGTYSILQAELSQRLLRNKVQALESDAPTLIATANIGCQLHLATRAGVPVRHWVELLDEVL